MTAFRATTATCDFLHCLEVLDGRGSFHYHRWLKGLGQSHREQIKTHARISSAQIAEIWNQLANEINLPHLGLEVGRQLDVGRFGLFEYLARTATTLGGGLGALARYNRMLHDSSVCDLASHRGRIHFRQRLSAIPEVTSPHLTELLFVSVVAMSRDLVGVDWSPRTVRFAHETRGDPGRYEDFFGAPVEFGADTDEVVLPARTLELPFWQGDLRLQRLLKQYARLVGFAEDHVGQVEADVRAILARFDCLTDVTIVDVAQVFQWGSRTLQRRLKAEGTNFSTVVEREMYVRSVVMLENPRTSPKEVAAQLGFRNVQTFYRAFRRWHGTSLKRYLQAVRAVQRDK